MSVAAAAGVTLEVERRYLGTPFTGAPTGSVAGAAAGMPLSIVHELPADGSSRWQARTVPAGGVAGAWMPFGLNAESEADVIRTSPSGGGGGGGGGCGATGGEVVALLILLVAGRRGRGSGDLFRDQRTSRIVTSCYVS